MGNFQEKQKSGFFRKRLMISVVLVVVLVMGGLFFIKPGHLLERIAAVGKNDIENPAVSYPELYRSVKGYYETGHIERGLAGLNALMSAGGEGVDLFVSEDSGSAETAAMSTADGGADYSDTDMQVEGIDEGDRILTDGEYIYTLENFGEGKHENDHKLHIIQTTGKETKEISQLLIEAKHSDDQYTASAYQDMYLDSEHKKLYLITWEQVWNKMDTEISDDEDTVEGDMEEKESGESLSNYYPSDSNGKTAVQVIDISDVKYPKVINTLRQDGEYKNSRFADGYLYLFSEYYVANAGKLMKEKKPETYVPKVNEKIIKEENITMPVKEENSLYTIITSLDVSEPEDFYDTKAVFSGHEVLYMGQNNFYLTRILLDDDVVSEIKNGTSEYPAIPTRIARYQYKKGKIMLKAVGEITGEVRNSYALHEYKGNLCVLFMKHGKKRMNGLYVLNKDLKQLGRIENLGAGEEIQSSFYVDHMAYFVTYQTKDPVFAVDVSEPEKPKLMSEVSLRGYSDYLHSFGKNRLVGLGYQEEESGEDEEHITSTVKLSLLHIDDEQKITESDTKLMKYQEYIRLYNRDHREVFVDEERGLLGFCVHMWNDESGKYRYLLYQLQGEKLVPVWEEQIKYPWYRWDSPLRAVRIGEVIYLVAANGTVLVH